MAAAAAAAAAAARAAAVLRPLQHSKPSAHPRSMTACGMNQSPYIHCQPQLPLQQQPHNDIQHPSPPSEIHPILGTWNLTTKRLEHLAPQHPLHLQRLQHLRSREAEEALGPAAQQQQQHHHHQEQQLELQQAQEQPTGQQREDEAQQLHLHAVQAARAAKAAQEAQAHAQAQLAVAAAAVAAAAAAGQAAGGCSGMDLLAGLQLTQSGGLEAHSLPLSMQLPVMVPTAATLGATQLGLIMPSTVGGNGPQLEQALVPDPWSCRRGGAH